MVGGVAVSRRHPGPVDVESGGRTGVAEPIGDGAHVDARGQQFGGNEMAEMPADVDGSSLREFAVKS